MWIFFWFSQKNILLYFFRRGRNRVRYRVIVLFAGLFWICPLDIVRDKLLTCFYFNRGTRSRSQARFETEIQTRWSFSHACLCWKHFFRPTTDCVFHISRIHIISWLRMKYFAILALKMYCRLSNIPFQPETVNLFTKYPKSHLYIFKMLEAKIWMFQFEVLFVRRKWAM